MFSQISCKLFAYNIILFLIITYVVSNRASKEPDYELGSKIIGGKPVPIEKYPASVKFYNFGALCSGTIINSWCVLTAAHCLDHNKEVYDMMVEVGRQSVNDGDSYTRGGGDYLSPQGCPWASVDGGAAGSFAILILLKKRYSPYPASGMARAEAVCLNQDRAKTRYILGSSYIHDSTGDVYAVLRVVIHEEYNKIQQFACDVALVFVTKPIKLGGKAKKAILVNDKEWMNTDVKNISVAGWGWTKYGGPVSRWGLMETRLRFVPSAECERLHELSLSPDMFCLYGDGVRDTCKGDSGGGVFWNDLVIGVVSHGDGCAKKDKPSVYASVWYFRRWIQEQLEHFFETACDMLPPEPT